jgi:hypothetical protein
MRTLDQGFEWHPATMWYPASSLGMIAGVLLGILAGVLAARAVTIHSDYLALSAPRAPSWGDHRTTPRVALKSTPASGAEGAAPAIWIPAALTEASRSDYAFPSVAGVPHETGKQDARSGRAFARRKHVPSKARSARQRRSSKAQAARASAKSRVALGKRRHKVVQRAPGRAAELRRGRTRAKQRRARTNRVRPAKQRRQLEPVMTQQRRYRPG